ncbi:hypothetical protein BS333_15285 [Vibrio azureus]|uniref:DUF350 domain-containing protein n=1 Tax=Vibrio azureus NBRC 104587 TaxID=1219077 RepID=U3C8E5_9VIBR|nr:DUF350 domain-containing protein [Vibrio azureus]AUI87762.1 hypothetical protein BS333_15285 [Vibrio azureus]GAD74713.1 hypothetical protein VAZ01S_014_00010 [Vibrio azureus NBRC 104587]
MEYIDLAALGNFAAYFFTGLACLLIFKYIAIAFTPYNEWKLIKEEKNIAAAIALGGSLIGYSIAINGVFQNAISYVDFATWAFVSLLTQIIAIKIVRFVFMPKFVQRIENNEVGAAVIAAALYIAIGLLNAGSMTY